METFPAAVIGSIEKYLARLLYSGIGLRPQLKVELESLEETVAAIVPAFIDPRLEENKADELNRLEIIHALYDVEDILIVLLIEAEESSSRLVSDATLMEKVRVFFAAEPQVYSTLEMAAQIHLIVEKIRTCASLSASSPVVDHNIVRTAAEPNSVVIGRDADKEKVMAFLFASGDNVHMTTLPIVGIGGIGKTTLVRLVFNDDRVTDHFDMRIWVGVSSEGLNVAATAREILRQILRVPAAANDLISQFKSVFKGKRFLLVLDGWIRWDYHGEKEWSQLHSLLVGVGANGSKILVTSRDMRVAKITKASSVHFLKGLSKEESLSLLMKIASKKESRSFEQIVLECAGAPFAIITAGKSLNLSTSGKVHLIGGIISVLKPTYDNLPSHLKPCLAYCSLFPRDYVFNVHELIYLWKAQRLVQMTEIERTVEQVGQEFVRDLISSLIFQDSVIDENGNIVECRMHPLFLQLSRFLTKGCCTCVEDSNFQHLLGGAVDVAHHVSIVTEQVPIQVLRRVPKNARTLIFLNKTSDIGWYVDNFIFTNLKELRTLRLRWLSDTAVSDLLGTLRHLRHLDLSESRRLKVLPGSIVKLLNLVTLILKNCCNLNKLPSGITRMTKLQELDLSGCIALTHLPNSIGQFVYLWILDLSGCSSLTYLPSGIAKLLNLRVLDLSGCSSLTHLPDGIGRFRVLTELDLSGCTSLTHLPESIAQLSHLSELDLSGCTSLTHLPTGISQLPVLTKLDLSGCSSLTHLPNGIGRLELLQTLGCFVVGDEGNAATIYSLQRLSGLKGHLEIKHLHRVTNNFDKDGPSILVNKLQLQSLKLCWDSSDVIIRGGGRATADWVLKKLQPPPNLMRVSIQGYCGYDADALSKSLYGLTKLVEIDIQECNWCTSLPRLHTLPHLKSIKLRKIRDLDYLGELDSTQVFPALQVLSLEYLPKLKGWRQSNDNGAAARVETDQDDLTFPTFSGEVHLDVVHTRSFSYAHGRDYLTLGTMTARILRRWLGINIVTGNNATSSSASVRVTPFTSVYSISLPQLNTLKIHDMGDIKFLPDEFFQRLSSLQHLEISHGRTMTTLSGAMIIHLMTALETLKIVDFPELDFDNDVKFKVVSSSSSSRLRRVRIGAVPKMKSLPLWFEHLTELEELVISDCIGLRTLQDGCCNFKFTSLRSIEIYGCQGLRFSRAVILQLITTLESIKICGCPELDITAGPAEDMSWELQPARLRRLHIQQVNDRMKRLPWWIQHLRSLEILEILYCKNLEILPYFLTKLGSLREIRVEYCGKLSEWCGPKRAHVYSIFDLPKTCRSPMMQMLFRASEAAKRSRKGEYTALVKLFSLYGEAKKDATEKHKRVQPVSGFGSSLKQHRPLRTFFKQHCPC